MNSVPLTLIGAVLLAASPAIAQDAGQDTRPLPTPDAIPGPAPICTDRPTKANVACTVPAGTVQVETDLANWTRLSIGNTQTDTVLYTNPFVKLGIGARTDIEANVVPYETVRFRDANGTVSTSGGAGDLYLRLKQRLTADGARIQVSIIPYVKAPTARLGIGNGEWEGGAILAASVPVPMGFTLVIGPEVDVLGDAGDAGHHANLTMVANLSHAIGRRLTVYGEVWTAQNLDPAGHAQQYSVDTAFAYLISPRLQVDLGANLGLNRATPGSQVYLGLSTRF